MGPPRGAFLSPQLAAQATFDRLDFPVQLSGGPLAVVDLDRRGHPFTVLRHGLVTPSDQLEEVLELPLDHGPHRVQSVGDAAAVHDFQAAGDVCPDAGPFPDGRDAEFRDRHESLASLISRRPFARCVPIDYSRRAEDYDA